MNLVKTEFIIKSSKESYRDLNVILEQLFVLKDVDTIVYAKRKEGVKHTFLDNEKWWEIRYLHQ